MVAGVNFAVLLAAGYTVFLAAVAFTLEMLARHSHRRSEGYRTSGFVYRRKMDLWECPAGRQLDRIDTDYLRRTASYRAPAHHCNACSLKNNCTDSDDGRLIEMRLDSWLESELRKFHRGISLALLALAILIAVVEMTRHAATHELLIMGAICVSLVIAEIQLVGSFFRRSNT